MKKLRKFQVAGLVMIAATAMGCHSVRRGEPMVGPMKLNPKEERGRIVFIQRCHQCHPNGEAGLGPALNNKPAPVFLMKTQVRLGLGAMPRFDKHTISAGELDDLMAYVIALRKADKEHKPPKANVEKSEKPVKLRSEKAAKPADETRETPPRSIKGQ
jgi:hypothetical protein